MDEPNQSDKKIIIIITKNGKPVSKQVPYQTKPNSLYGINRDQIIIHGDIIEPLDDVEWEAAQQSYWIHIYTIG